MTGRISVPAAHRISIPAVRRLNVILPIVSTDPAPDYIENYRMDGNDVNVVYSGTEDHRSEQLAAAPDAVNARFSGTNYATASADASSFDFGTDPFSISCRISSTNTGGSLQFFATNDINLRLNATGSIRWNLDGTNLTSSGANFNEGQTHNVVVTSTGPSGTMEICVDGVSQGTTAAPNYNITGTATVALGNRVSLASPFVGTFDDLRIYSRVLTGTEITGLNDYHNGFGPALITTEGWYDTNYITSITEAASLVSQIDDIGTLGAQHLVQGDGAKQPTTGTRMINGLNVLDGDGGDFLRDTAFTHSGSGDVSIFTVVTFDTINSAGDAIHAFDSATNDYQFIANNATQFDGRVQYSTGSDTSLTGGPFTGPNIFCLEWDFSDDGEYSVFVDGTSSITPTAYTAALDSPTSFNLFTNRAINQSPDGAFGETLIICDITEDTRQKVEGYLAWKWGLVANLDGGHPYKTEPPKV